MAVRIVLGALAFQRGPQDAPVIIELFTGAPSRAVSEEVVARTFRPEGYVDGIDDDGFNSDGMEDHSVARHGYGPSATPTLLIAVGTPSLLVSAEAIVSGFLDAADGSSLSDLEAVGWVGNSRSLIWVTMRSLEASKRLQRYIVRIHLTERADLEVFQVLHIYDD